MLWHITRREIVDNFRSLRLSLTFILVTTAMAIIGFVFIGNYKEQIEDYSHNTNSNFRQLPKWLKEPVPLFRIASWSGQSIYMRPNPLQFLAEGHEKDLPNTFNVRAFRIEGPQNKKRSNFMLWRFADIDWAFVVSVIMSFVAITLTYDAISGERERGTLRLVMSNSVSRATVFLAKYLGAMISIAIPLAVGIFLNLIIISLSGVLSLSGEEWAKVGMMVFLSLIYISIFAMLGLFISSMTKESSTSLVILLLIWVILVVIIPQSGGLMASKLYKMPSQKEMVGRLAADMDAAWKRNPMNHSLQWSPGEPLSGGIEFGDVWNRILDEYRNAMFRRAKLARNITKISPQADFSDAAEAIAGTGLPHFESFSKQARMYKEELLSFVKTEEEKNKRNPNLRYAVDFDAIPQFEDKFPPTDVALQSSLMDILIMTLFNVLFLMGAFVAFLRYDVR